MTNTINTEMTVIEYLDGAFTLALKDFAVIVASAAFELDTEGSQEPHENGDALRAAFAAFLCVVKRKLSNSVADGR
jgi:hypothetical protein